MYTKTISIAQLFYFQARPPPLSGGIYNFNFDASVKKKKKTI